MKTQPRHPFSPDRPIEKIQDDLLGRAEIARSIATAIENWKGQDALVMALYGGWADGKSSLKGMVVDALKKEASECPFIVAFNPWEWTNSQQLARAFFDEIANQIASQGTGTEKIKAKRCAKGLKKLAMCLLFGGSVISAISPVAALLDPEAAILFKVLAEAMKKSGKVSQQGSQVAEESQPPKDGDILSIKKELRTALSELNRPVLVLVDDVDRLAAEDVKLLFQLVKANSDFPNVIFFMLFQRDIVENCLEKTMQSGNGRAFLEKIIQVGLQLPQIQQPMLDGFLEKRLDEVLANYQLEKNFDKDRWRKTYADCLSPYFKNLRDINRFFSTFEFLIPLFIKPVLEVNLVDLFALEVLRVFQPDAYNAIANCRPILWGDSKRFSLNGILPETKTADYLTEIKKQIFAAIPSEKAQQVESVFDELFPLNWYRGNNGQFAQDLRVCSQEYFDRYFKWCVPKGDLSQADLNELLINLGNREKLSAKLLLLNHVSLGWVALQRLKLYASRFQKNDAEAFAATLFDVGDELALKQDPPNGPNILLNLTEDLIKAHLNPAIEHHNYLEILKKAMATSTGLYLPFMVTVREYFSKEQNGITPGSLNDAMIDNLKSLASERIKTAAYNGVLETHPRLYDFLRIWKMWGDPADVRQFCKTIVNKRPLVLIEAFFIKHPDPVSEITDQKDFLDLDLLSVSIKNLKANLIITREKDLCDLFERLFEDYRRKPSIQTEAAAVPTTS